MFTFARVWRQRRHRPSCKLETGSRRDETQFTPYFETRQNCLQKTKHVQLRNFRSPTVLSNRQFSSHHRRRRESLLSSASAVWTELQTRQDCRRLKISKLNMFSFFLQFCRVSKCGVNWVSYRLDPVSNLQLDLWRRWRHTRAKVNIVCELPFGYE